MSPSFWLAVIGSLCAFNVHSTSVVTNTAEWETYFNLNTYLDSDQTVRLFWKAIDDDFIEIGLSYPTTGWFGFGISPNGQMPNSDIALAWIDDNDGTITLQDRHTTSTRPDGPIIDDNQNLQLLYGEQTNGGSYVAFKRSINPCDQTDRDILQGTTRVIYSYSINGADTPSYHGSNRGSQSVNFLSGSGNDVELEQDTETFELTLSSHTPTITTDLYYSEILELPATATTKHITSFESVITAGNHQYVHHMIMYNCIAADNILPSDVGNVYILNDPSDSLPCADQVSFAWSVGGYGFSFPSNVGLEMNVNQMRYVRLEIHYTNPNHNSFSDASGIRIYYTGTLREESAGLIQIHYEYSQQLIIPAGLSSARARAYCTPDCTAQPNALPIDGVTVVANTFHAHLIAVGMSLRHIRDGVELAPIDINDGYDDDFQQTTTFVEGQESVILPGDDLILECVFNSESRTAITYGGLTKEDEMCVSFLYVYPKPELSRCASALNQNDIYQWMGGAFGNGYLTGSDPSNFVYDATIPGSIEYYETLLGEHSIYNERECICYGVDENGEDVNLDNGLLYTNKTNIDTPYEDNKQCTDLQPPPPTPLYFIIRNFYGGILTDNEVGTDRVHFECTLNDDNQIWQIFDNDNNPNENVECLGNGQRQFRNKKTGKWLVSTNYYVKVTADNTDNDICWRVTSEAKQFYGLNFEGCSGLNYRRLQNAETLRYPHSGDDCKDMNGVAVKMELNMDDSSLFIFEPAINVINTNPAHSDNGDNDISLINDNGDNDNSFNISFSIQTGIISLLILIILVLLVIICKLYGEKKVEYKSVATFADSDCSMVEINK